MGLMTSTPERSSLPETISQSNLPGPHFASVPPSESVPLLSESTINSPPPDPFLENNIIPPANKNNSSQPDLSMSPSCSASLPVDREDSNFLLPASRKIPSTGRALSPVVEENDPEDSVFEQPGNDSDHQILPVGSQPEGSGPVNQSASHYNLRKRRNASPVSLEGAPKRNVSVSDVFARVLNSDGEEASFGMKDFFDTLRESQIASVLSVPVSVSNQNEQISTIVISGESDSED